MKTLPSSQEQAQAEMATRELEKRNKEKRESFKEFVQYFFKNEKKKNFVWNWHHKSIADELIKLMNNEFDLLIINIPPRHGKTEEATKLFPVWWLGNNPDYKVMSTGYSANLTKTFSGEARDYYNSATYKQIFPRRVELKKDQNTKEHWQNEEEGSYYATGAGGTITGHGADLIIIDDPLNPKEAEASSQIELEKINEWFSNTILSRRNARIKGKKKIMGKIVIIMQRLHDNDLCGYIKREYPEFFESGAWKELVLPAIATEDEEHRKEGEALFPQMYDLDYLGDTKKTMKSKRGANYFGAQYQQDPVDAENAEFKREFIQYKKQEEILGLCKTGIISVDPAESQKETADYRAITVWGRTLTGEYCKMKERYGRWSTGEFIDEIFNIQYAYGWNVILEVNKSKLIGEMIRAEMKRRDRFFSMEEVINTGSKEERIRTTMQPLYENFQVFHDEGLAYGEGEDELLRFPKSAHDDVIDADEMAVRKLRDQGFRPPDHKKVAKKIRQLQSQDNAYT